MTDEHNSLRNIQQKKSQMAPQHKLPGEEIIPDGTFSHEENANVGSNLLESILGENTPEEDMMASFKDIPDVPEEAEKVENIYAPEEEASEPELAEQKQEDIFEETNTPESPVQTFETPSFDEFEPPAPVYEQPARPAAPTGKHSLKLVFADPLVVGFKNSSGAAYSCEFDINQFSDAGPVKVGLDSETSLEMASAADGFNVLFASQGAGKISVSAARGPKASKAGQYYKLKIHATDMTLQIFPGASFKTAGFSVSITEDSVDIVC